MVCNYEDECSAINYAHHIARMTGARALVFNRRGDVEFCERSKPIVCARPDASNRTAVAQE